MKALAIDLGGSHVTCAIVEDKGLIASQLIQINNNKSLRALLPVIAATLKDLMMQQDCEPKDLTGCAFGFCGLVNFDANQILSTNGKFIDAPELNLTTWSKEELGLPLALENDARLALLGEQYIGAARGYDDAVMITLGTGIGGAAMIKGKLLRGKHFQAGCLGGHFPISLKVVWKLRPQRGPYLKFVGIGTSLMKALCRKNQILILRD
jgi:glucokinase